jgi:hypothetical protein
MVAIFFVDGKECEKKKLNKKKIKLCIVLKKKCIFAAPKKMGFFIEI